MLVLNTSRIPHMNRPVIRNSFFIACVTTALGLTLSVGPPVHAEPVETRVGTIELELDVPNKNSAQGDSGFRVRPCNLAKMVEFVIMAKLWRASPDCLHPVSSITSSCAVIKDKKPFTVRLII